MSSGFITATPRKHEEVEALFRRLESAAPDARLALRAYPIRKVYEEGAVDEDIAGPWEHVQVDLALRPDGSPR